MKARTILETVGNTPMVEINGIYAKLEAYNPTGSVKDRMALHMVKKAEERGELKGGSRIIEVTSGNTGVALAMISAVRGYDFTAVMPESMSIERRKMIAAFGAKLVLTPAKEDMAGAVRKYEELVKKDPDAWLPRQFENADNIEAHELGLGKEIADEFGPEVDAFVAGVGTGGTLLGVAKALKKANPNVRIIAVEPAESQALAGCECCIHKIQGIGEGFVPTLVREHRDMIDEVIAIKSDDAIAMMKELAKKHGLLVGISSGANMLAAMKAKEKYKTVVTLLPDRGERYLSSL